MPARVIVYTTDSCSYCRRAESLLGQLSVKFDDIDVTDDSDKRRWLVEATGRRTVPQIFVDGVAIGGYDDLAAMVRSGEFQRRMGLGPTGG